MKKLVVTKACARQINKLIKGNSTNKKLIQKAFQRLQTDYSQPALRLHKLSGKDYWSVSVAQDLRLLILVETKKIYLIKIGTHDDVY